MKLTKAQLRQLRAIAEAQRIAESVPKLKLDDKAMQLRREGLVEYGFESVTYRVLTDAGKAALEAAEREGE